MSLIFGIMTLILQVLAVKSEVKNMEFTLRNKSDVIMLPLDEQHSAEGDLDCAIKCAMSQNDCYNFYFDDDNKVCTLGHWILSKDAVNTPPTPPSTSSKLFTRGKYCEVNETVTTVGNGRMGSCHTAACQEQNNVAKKQTNVLNDPLTYRTCSDVKNSTNPRQLLQLSSGLVVMCDTVTDGGGWTIFQRRVSGVVDFYRNWEEYKHGFGDFDAGEFYLGNENIYCLTTNRSYELRIDMTYKGTNYYATYSSFTLNPESSYYKIYVAQFSGNVFDSFSLKHNNQSFSTYDKDNDKDARDCAEVFHAGWWYSNCRYTNLNGLYGSTDFGKGLNWYSITGDTDGVQSCEMKLRPIE